MRRLVAALVVFVSLMVCAALAYHSLSSSAKSDRRYRLAVDLVKQNESHPASVEIDCVYFGRPRSPDQLICVRYRSTDEQGVRKLRSRVVNVTATDASFYGDYEWLTRMGPDAQPNEWSLNPKHFERR